MTAEAGKITLPQPKNNLQAQQKDNGEIKEGLNDLTEPDSHAAKIKSSPNDLLEPQNAAEKIKEGDFDLALGATGAKGPTESRMPQVRRLSLPGSVAAHGHMNGRGPQAQRSGRDERSEGREGVYSEHLYARGPSRRALARRGRDSRSHRRRLWDVPDGQPEAQKNGEQGTCSPFLPLYGAVAHQLRSMAFASQLLSASTGTSAHRHSHSGTSHRHSATTHSATATHRATHHTTASASH